MMDKKQAEPIYKLTMQRIEAFANTLTPEEREQLAHIPTSLFAKIWQAAGIAALDLAHEATNDRN